MYIDDLPIWGIVGEIGADENQGDFFLWTHKKFEIGYNGDQIVEVSVTSENKVKLVQGAKINFSYEVSKLFKNIILLNLRLCGVNRQLHSTIDTISTSTPPSSSIESTGSPFSTHSWWSFFSLASSQWS